MAVTFDNPTNVNGLIIVAFKTDANQTVSLDASTYMNEIYSVVANAITSATFAITPFDAADQPFSFPVPLLVEWAGITITLKQVHETAATVTTTIVPATTGIIIGRK